MREQTESITQLNGQEFSEACSAAMYSHTQSSRQVYLNLQRTGMQAFVCDVGYRSTGRGKDTVSGKGTPSLMEPNLSPRGGFGSTGSLSHKAVSKPFKGGY